jgi:cellulose biosynthesis protein BcsQ
MSEESRKATFVTFYSFKGGVGRSMALINTAGILAGQRGFRVLVIDVDLEAPGLSYLDPSAPDESPSQIQRELPYESGFVDLLTDAKLSGETADLFKLTPDALAEKYTKTITIPTDSREFPDGSLRVMPAGKLDATYASRLNALNIGDLYRVGIGEPLIRAFKKKIAESGLYDYVLVDSRTGLSDEAGMCTRDLADHLMILSGLNRQNVEGTSEFLRALLIATEGKKTLQIILSPMPNGEDRLADEREKIAGKAFSDAWKTKIDLSLQIPYHPQLALTEEPHIFRRRKGYLFESYRAIERRMLRQLGHTAQAFLKRTFTSLRKGDHAAALRDLQHMIRLENGEGMLSRFAEEIAFPERRRVQPNEDTVRTPITLEALSKDTNGLKILQFMVERLQVGEHGWASKSFAEKLSKEAPELANTLYLRLVDSTPTDPELSLAYARFLRQQPDKLETANSYYLRAIESSPEDVHFIGDYARFLANFCGNLEGAETYYKRALSIEPEEMHYTGDYGQVLAAKGEFVEAENRLLAAFSRIPQSETGNRAELCIALWLVAQMQKNDEKRWEREFKFLIAKGFDRHQWSFDQMLERAHKVLSADEFAYAQALAAAFLDAEKVADLESFPRWTALEPLTPGLRKPKLKSHRASK